MADVAFISSSGHWIYLSTAKLIQESKRTLLLKNLATHVLKVFTIRDPEDFFVFCGANEHDLAGYGILRQGNVQMINPS